MITSAGYLTLQKPTSAIHLSDPRKLTLGLLFAVLLINLGAIAAFALADFMPNAIRYFMAYKLGLDREQAVPAWFATLLIAGGAVVCTMIAYRFWALKRPGWLAASGFAAVLWWVSMDENVSIHEHFSQFEVGGLFDLAIFHYGWVIYGLLIVAVLSIFMLPAIRHLEKNARRWLLAGIGVFCGGAIGVEVISGLVLQSGHTEASLPYFLCGMAEENAEMIGMILILHGLVHQLRQTPSPLAVQKDAHARAAAESNVVDRKTKSVSTRLGPDLAAPAFNKRSEPVAHA
jgi:hypothetical protein